MNAKAKTDVNKSGEQSAPPLSIDIYKEICNNIRVTDEISFKLLNIVPLISGIGSTALVFLEKSQLLTNYSSYAVVSFSICGALITFGLFRWELRNVQKCNWLIERAGDFERRLLKEVALEKEQTIQFADFTKDIKLQKVSPIRDRPWGKTQAEKLIYSVAIVVWLVPVIIVVLRDMETMGSIVRKNFHPV